MASPKASLQRIRSRARKKAEEQRHTVTAVGAGAIMGLARKEGWNLPKFNVPGFSTEAQYGLIALAIDIWGVGGQGMRQVASGAADGLLAIAAHQFTSAGAAASGYDEYEAAGYQGMDFNDEETLSEAEVELD